MEISAGASPRIFPLFASLGAKLDLLEDCGIDLIDENESYELELELAI
jgi:hypothetical protein